jgi:hypothetical protein
VWKGNLSGGVVASGVPLPDGRGPIFVSTTAQRRVAVSEQGPVVEGQQDSAHVVPLLLVRRGVAQVHQEKPCIVKKTGLIFFCQINVEIINLKKF